MVVGCVGECCFVIWYFIGLSHSKIVPVGLVRCQKLPIIIKLDIWIVIHIFILTFYYFFIYSFSNLLLVLSEHPTQKKFYFSENEINTEHTCIGLCGPKGRWHASARPGTWHAPARAWHAMVTREACHHHATHMPRRATHVPPLCLW